MQGDLSQINIQSLLQLIELNQRTGELLIEAGDGRFWSLFFRGGHLTYATDGSFASRRLEQCTQRLNLELSFSADVPSDATSAPEYQLLCGLVERQSLTITQIQQLIRLGAEEILLDLLRLPAGAFIFETTAGLTPVLLSLEASDLLLQADKRLGEWQKLTPLIESADQKPVIVDRHALEQELNPQVYIQLQQWINGKHTLRELARLLGKDFVTVARAIAPYLTRGVIQISDTQLPTRTPRPKRTRRIACVDDSISIQKSVELFLQVHGYEVQTISNPLKAFSDLFTFKPDLILLDIAMPRLDGYELCAMIRKSQAFKQTPVIMLTGKDGYIDRMRARMAGATEYLTKPFGERELFDAVERYVGQELSIPHL
ncbi:MAG: response regulator [Gemmatimonadaceae bacterium]|nr:response regulator [Gloeobacterales cyanobacterium ES-bin-141]